MLLDNTQAWTPDIEAREVDALQDVVHSNDIQRALQALAEENPRKPLRGYYYEQCNRIFRQSSNQQQHMLEWALRNTQHHVSTDESFDVLSIGCGCGIFDLPFLKRLMSGNEGTTFNYVGVDYNNEQVKHLRAALYAAKLELLNYRIDYADIANWQPDQLFDCILLVHSLYYIPNPFKVLDKARALLKPGGKILIFSAEKDGINMAAEAFVQADEIPRDNNNYVFNDTIDRYLKQREVPAQRECLNATFDASSIFAQIEDDRTQLLSFLAQIDLRETLNTENLSVFNRWLKALPVPGSSKEYAVHHPVWAYQFS